MEPGPGIPHGPLLPVYVWRAIHSVHPTLWPHDDPDPGYRILGLVESVAEEKEDSLFRIKINFLNSLFFSNIIIAGKISCYNFEKK